MRKSKRDRARENNETIVVDSSIGGRGDHCCQVVKGGGEIFMASPPRRARKTSLGISSLGCTRKVFLHARSCLRRGLLTTRIIDRSITSPQAKIFRLTLDLFVALCELFGVFVLRIFVSSFRRLGVFEEIPYLMEYFCNGKSKLEFRKGHLGDSFGISVG